MLPIPSVRTDNSPAYVRDIADSVRTLANYVRPSPSLVTADYDLVIAGELVEVDATGGNITLTLPAAKDFARDTIWIVRTDSAMSTVTVAAAAGETVNGASTVTVGSGYGKLQLVSTGTKWLAV